MEKAKINELFLEAVVTGSLIKGIVKKGVKVPDHTHNMSKSVSNHPVDKTDVENNKSIPSGSCPSTC